jgi:hypothetical protein
MKSRLSVGVRAITHMMLVPGLVALSATAASAQTTGTGTGTGTGTAAAGTGAATSPGGVGGNASGGFGTNVGSSSAAMGTGGLGSTNFTGGTGQTSISKADPFYYYYASPLSAGFGPNVNLLPQNSLSFSSSGGVSGTLVTGKGTFGAPVANITTSTTGGKGATGGGGGGAGGSANVTSNFTTIGMKRAPSYVTMIDPELITIRSPVAMSQLQQDVRASLQNSTALPTGQNLNVVLDNDTLVLTGTVATDRERRLAENLARLNLTGGVRNVRNQIQLATATPRP